MKKYTSGAFESTTYGIYKSAQDTITSFPASIITNGGNITPWSIYGNTSGGQSVGEKTANLLEGVIDGIIAADGTITSSQSYQVYYAQVQSGETYTMGDTIDVYGFFNSKPAMGSVTNDGTRHFYSGTVGGVITIPEGTTWLGCRVATGVNAMLNLGSTALPYEPHGYKLPVVIGSTTTNIYMADVLRMSSGADPVYDIMSSTGVITRNVDTDGSPLPTPTTESFTVPTLATVAGSQSFNIDTTVKPSSVSLTYTGWHTHADKQYSGGSWGQVTSNAKVLRRKKSAKSKT